MKKTPVQSDALSGQRMTEKPSCSGWNKKVVKWRLFVKPDDPDFVPSESDIERPHKEKRHEMTLKRM